MSSNEEIITKALNESLSTVFPGSVISETSFESPKEKSFGDVAFPCHLLSRSLKLPPQKISELLIPTLSDVIKNYPLIVKVEAKGPYVNFFLNQAIIAASLLPQFLSGEGLKRRSNTNVRMMIEYSQPNTHKAFHVGHVRNASLGDSLSRIFDWLGNEVVPVNYIGDEGTHVAKCLWYYEKFAKGVKPKSNKGEFLGDFYSKSTNLLDLAALTEAPFIGVVVAEVLNVSKHPKKPEWNVVTVKYQQEERTVVTAAKGVSQGVKVAYVAPGVRLGTKKVATLEKEGVVSSGMLLSEKEAAKSDDNDKLWILPKDAPLGVEVSEVFRTDDSSLRDRPLLEILKERESEVSKILQGMESGDPYLKALWDETREWSLDEFKEIYKWLGCRFDHYFFESELGERSKELVRKYQAKGVFVESDGAIGADLKQFGLGFCILIKRDGTALYATRDLSLAEDKFDKFKIDRSIYVVDAAQTLHFQQVFKCLELMGYKQASKCYHLPYAQVVRPEGKMSSRKGNVILFSELKERLVKKANVEFLDKYRGDWQDSEIDNAAHVISLATIRYGMLKPDNNSTVVFDLDEWSERSGNTGPYMLYAYARIRSILRDVGSQKDANPNWALLEDETELDVIRALQDFDVTIKRAGDQYSPHLVCMYVYDLAKRFSRMYKACSVSNAPTVELKVARAALIESVGNVIKTCLNLLGIPVLERM